VEILVAIDALDDMVHMAPEVPLTDSVRHDEADLKAGVERVRSEATALFGGEPGRQGAIGEVFDALAGLDDQVAHAKAVPLTDQVRVNRERLYEGLDRLRAALPPAIEQRGSPGAVPPRWSAVLDAVDALERRMHDYERSLIPWMAIEAGVLREASARVRVAATQSLGPPGRPRDPVTDLFAALDELDALVGVAPATDRVRVSRTRPFVLIGWARDAVLAAVMST
jgi:hypothetical protein